MLHESMASFTNVLTNLLLSADNTSATWKNLPSFPKHILSISADYEDNFDHQITISRNCGHICVDVSKITKKSNYSEDQIIDPLKLSLLLKWFSEIGKEIPDQCEWGNDEVI